MYSILIPVFNEEEILESSLQQLQAYLEAISLEYEILILDNGSDDETNAVAARLASRMPQVRALRCVERGPGKAFQLGVKEAKGEFIVTLDADLSSELRFIEYARDLLAYGDAVIGSKTMGTQRRTLFRILGSQGYILFTQVFFDLTIADYSIGSKAFRRAEILSAVEHLDHWTGYIFELCLFLKLRGAKIVQIGIDCDDHRKSHFNLMHEGFYRYRHLYRCWKKLRDKSSWFYHE